MVIFIGFILLILGLVVISLRGFFGIFPDNWEWVGIVLAGVGLIMSAPSMLQMMLGKPFPIVTLERGALGKNRNLHITLRNAPLSKDSIWRRLGVDRDTIHSLEVWYQVLAGNIVIQVPIRATIYDDSDETHKNRVMLPPTFTPAVSVFIVEWDENSPTAMLAGDNLHEPLELKTGSYSLDIQFL